MIRADENFGLFKIWRVERQTFNGEKKQEVYRKKLVENSVRNKARQVKLNLARKELVEKGELDPKGFNFKT